VAAADASYPDAAADAQPDAAAAGVGRRLRNSSLLALCWS
jgi:hypothetical protein